MKKMKKIKKIKAWRNEGKIKILRSIIKSIPSVRVVQNLVHYLCAIRLAFHRLLENTPSEYRLIKDAFVYGARLFGVLEFGPKYLVMLVQNPTLLRKEHELVVFVVIVDRTLNQSCEWRTYRWIAQRVLGIFMGSITLNLEIVLLHHILDVVSFFSLFGRLDFIFRHQHTLFQQ